jgi:hypothetical protein
MAPTIKNRDHPTAGNTPAQRIAARLRNSGSPEASTVVQKGSGPTRAITNIHPSGSAKQHPSPAVGSNKAFRGEHAGPLNAGNKDRDL